MTKYGWVLTNVVEVMTKLGNFMKELLNLMFIPINLAKTILFSSTIVINILSIISNLFGSVNSFTELISEISKNILEGYKSVINHLVSPEIKSSLTDTELFDSCIAYIKLGLNYEFIKNGYVWCYLRCSKNSKETKRMTFEKNQLFKTLSDCE